MAVTHLENLGSIRRNLPHRYLNSYIPPPVCSTPSNVLEVNRKSVGNIVFVSECPSLLLWFVFSINLVFSLEELLLL